MTKRAVLVPAVKVRINVDGLRSMKCCLARIQLEDIRWECSLKLIFWMMQMIKGGSCRSTNHTSVRFSGICTSLECAFFSQLSTFFPLLLYWNICTLKFRTSELHASFCFLKIEILFTVKDLIFVVVDVTWSGAVRALLLLGSIRSILEGECLRFGVSVQSGFFLWHFHFC